MIEARTKRSSTTSKPEALGLLLAAIVAVGLMLLTARPAHAATFTVNSTDDDAVGDSTPDGTCDSDPTIFLRCTLREAIQEANATEAADTIAFGVPGSGPHTISPAAALPPITQPLTIDGYTQGSLTPDTADDAQENTLATGGTNAVLKIELDGSGIGQFAFGLGVLAPNCVIRGLAINRFGGGISIDERDNRVEGNFIGTDPGGTLDNRPNGFGVAITSGTNSSIGGATPAARNLISGNGNTGVLLGSSGNKVEGNLIGVQKDGTSALGNDNFGVSVFSSNNTVGGGEAAANTIAFSGEDGVKVDDGATSNRILGNPIFSNGGLGIDLEGGIEDANGRTANDPRDPDAGPNNLQNFPILASATVSGGQLTVTGNLNSNPSTQIVRRKKKKKKKRRTVFVPQTFTVQFFSNPPGENEGKTFLGQAILVTNLSGDAPIDLTFAPSQPVSTWEQITATATRNATGDTSEFSNSVTAN